MASNPPSVMEHPLVIWIQTFSAEPVTYLELCEGAYLNDVICQIDPRAQTDTIIGHPEDVKERMQNWDTLLKNIRTYYKDVLQQYIVMKLPSILVISKEPESAKAKSELIKVLLMVLGCAVQCEQREMFVENIMKLNTEVQHAIMQHIQEITDQTKNVFSIEIASDHLDDVSRNMLHHLKILIEERDGYIEEVKELSSNLEDLYQSQQQSEAQKSMLGQLSPGPGAVQGTSPEKHHLAVELAESKAKLRKLRQEYEEKTELSVELQEELEEHKSVLEKLRKENLDLVHDARAARAYRDELDIMKEKANRVDKFEIEITKYKEKLNELNFFKARVEELREDNAVLVETKVMLEDQLATSHKRVETVVDLESEILKLNNQLEQITNSRDKDRVRIQELEEANARLEFEKKSSFNESANLEDELMRTRQQLHQGLSNSLSDQLSETQSAKILRLELENQRLSKTLEEIKDSHVLENTTRAVELEKENQRLAKKVEKLQQSASKETQSLIQQEQLSQDLHRQKEGLTHTIETIRETSQRQILELERENNQLSETVETLRARNEKTMDLRVKDIEKENKRLHEEVKDFSAQVSKLDYERRSVQKEYDRLKENVEHIKEIEEENQRYEKGNEDLKKANATLQLTCDRYEKFEQEASDLDVENRKLSKMVESLKKSLAKMEILENDNFNLTVEVQQLKRTKANMKSSASQLEDLQEENEELAREVASLQKSLGSFKSEKAKQDQLEINLLELDTENQKLQRNLEGTTRKLEEVEQENVELEKQVGTMHKSMETMRLSVRRLEDLEQEIKELEVENSATGKEKLTIEKENRRLKQALEMKEAMIEEINSQLVALEKENKNLRKQADRNTDTSTRILELERENLEMAQKSSLDKKTLSTLREDLVNEKIRTQQLSNDLEKLTHELECIGLDREKLTAADQAHDESKYKALEGMMEEAFRKSMELKEEKILALESRLDESKSRNMQLQEELKAIKRDFAALQQRREEEVMLTATPEADSFASQKSLPNATREILELKDHMITVERNNATLEAEKRNLKHQATAAQERIGKLEGNNNHLQYQVSSVEGQNKALQSQLAFVQVENTTLQSQNTSLMSQNAALQNKHTSLESEQHRLVANHDELQTAHDTLMTDHEALQKLHDQLTVEYEHLLSEHGSLKANHKTLKAELKDLKEHSFELSRDKEVLQHLKSSMEQDRANMKSESKSVSNLQLDLLHLREENIRLRNVRDKVQKEYGDLQSEHKAIKTEYNQLQLKHTQLQGTYNDCKDQVSSLDVEISKMASKCEALNQLNVKLEEENRALMMQLQALLNQNQELLTQSLENKDQFHEEERAYMEKLTELRRQKEKLEEKIMEQYKRYDPVKKKNRGFGANLVRKAKAMVSRGNRSKERSQTVAIGSGEFSLAGESPENSSLGSSDFTDSGTFSKRRNNVRTRHNSSGDLLDSPKLSRQKKALTQSTTALNLLKDDQKTPSKFKLRGAKSSENLLSMGTPRSPRKVDNDSLSSSTGSTQNTEWPSRPGRRRQLLDSSGRGGSVSSEEGGFVRPGQFRSKTPTPRSAIVGGDSDGEDNMISLIQFLQEVDKSPKSRRKFLISKNIDPDEKEDKTVEIVPEPPPAALEPRSPIIESDENTRPKTPNRPKTPSDEIARRLNLSAKSEGNLSNVSKLNSASSLASYMDRGDYGSHSTFATPRSILQQDMAVRTSTPKYKNQEEEYRGHLERQRMHSSGDEPSSPRRQDTSGQYSRRASMGEPRRGMPPRQLSSDYDILGHSQNGMATPSSSSSSSSLKQSMSMYNLPRPNNKEQINSPGNSGLDYTPHNAKDSYALNNNQESYNDANSSQDYSSVSLPRQNSHRTNNNQVNNFNSMPRPPSRGSSLSFNCGNSTVVRQNSNESGNYSQYSYENSQRPSQGRKIDPTDQAHHSSWDENADNRLGGEKINVNAIEQDVNYHSQYMPGNVRNLVQNYQKSLNQGPIAPSPTPAYPGQGGPIGQGGLVGSGGREAPVPPPRRSRPMSAGPMRANMVPFAFSGPSGAQDNLQQGQTMSYTQSSVGGPTPQLRPGTGRVLPQRPDEIKSSTSTAGQTPPRPASAGRAQGEPPKKNSIWYEYGCV